MTSHLFPRWCGPNDHYNYGCYYHLSIAAIIGIVFACISLFLFVLFLWIVCARRGRYSRHHGRRRDEEAQVGGSGIRGGGTTERRSRGNTRQSSRRKGRNKRVRRFPDPY